MDLAGYSNELVQRFRRLTESFLKEEEPLSTTERCCVCLTANNMTIIGIRHNTLASEVRFYETFHYEKLNELQLVLKGLVQKHQLRHTPVFLLLNPEDYELNLIESLPVPKNEFMTALSWRIRSLLAYPIDEALMDYFELPAKKNSPTMPLIGAVTSQRSKVSSKISTIKNCGLTITTIDIPELAMANLSALHESDEKSTAFLYFYENYVILNISRQKQLYFTRRIGITRMADANIDFEKLSLEILRYFDFFRSQWRLAAPTRFLAAAEKGETQIITQRLSERLLNKVDAYQLPSSMFSEEVRQQIATHYLLDFGCLLRKDAGDVTPRN